MHSLSRRQFTVGALGVAATTGMSEGIRAATWPQRTVTVVVPYPAGGNTDTMGRIATNWLASRLRQGFIIDNRGGAGGAIGTAYVARAERDGYTLLFAASPQVSIVPLV